MLEYSLVNGGLSMKKTPASASDMGEAARGLLR